MDELTRYVGDQYDHFQNSLEKMNKARKYLNYGFTTADNRAASYEDQQERLCHEAFRLAGIEPHHSVVDVGFGSAEQDFLLHSLYPFKTLTGFNVARKQVLFANRRAQAEGLGDRMTFHYAPAEDMSVLADNSIDRLLSIECAFYFDRVRFYREAARVLKPGGRVVLADISFRKPLKFLTRRSEDFRRVGTLAENRALWEQHFRTVDIIDINRETRPGTQRTVFKCLESMFFGLNGCEIKTFFKMACYTQLVALGLLTNLVSYDFIVLEKI